MREGKVIEGRLQRIVSHRVVRRNFFLLLKPGKGGFFISKAVHKLEATACRPVKTRPSDTCVSWPSSKLRRSFTRPLNQLYESRTIASIAARASGLVGSKPLGAAFNGEDFTSSTLMPIVLSTSEKFGY